MSNEKKTFQPPIGAILAPARYPDGSRYKEYKTRQGEIGTTGLFYNTQGLLLELVITGTENSFHHGIKKTISKTIYHMPIDKTENIIADKISQSFSGIIRDRIEQERTRAVKISSKERKAIEKSAIRDFFISKGFVGEQIEILEDGIEDIYDSKDKVALIAQIEKEIEPLLTEKQREALSSREGGLNAKLVAVIKEYEENSPEDNAIQKVIEKEQNERADSLAREYYQRFEEEARDNPFVANLLENSFKGIYDKLAMGNPHPRGTDKHLDKTPSATYQAAKGLNLLAETTIFLGDDYKNKKTATVGDVLDNPDADYIIEAKLSNLASKMHIRNLIDNLYLSTADGLNTLLDRVVELAEEGKEVSVIRDQVIGEFSGSNVLKIKTNSIASFWVHNNKTEIPMSLQVLIDEARSIKDTRDGTYNKLAKNEEITPVVDRLISLTAANRINPMGSYIEALVAFRDDIESSLELIRNRTVELNIPIAKMSARELVDVYMPSKFNPVVIEENEKEEGIAIKREEARKKDINFSKLPANFVITLPLSYSIHPVTGNKYVHNTIYGTQPNKDSQWAVSLKFPRAGKGFASPIGYLGKEAADFVGLDKILPKPFLEQEKADIQQERTR